jgi:hypothetical protein
VATPTVGLLGLDTPDLQVFSRHLAALTTDQRRSAIQQTAPWLFTAAAVVSPLVSGFAILKKDDLTAAAQGFLGAAAILLAVSLALAAFSTISDPESKLLETGVVFFAIAILIAGAIPLLWAIA